MVSYVGGSRMLVSLQGVCTFGLVSAATVTT